LFMGHIVAEYGTAVHIETATKVQKMSEVTDF
jgi:hypothetical protein